MASLKRWLGEISNYFTGANNLEENEVPSELDQKRRLFLSATLLLSISYVYALIAVILFPDQFNLTLIQIVFVGFPIVIFYSVALYNYHPILEWLFPIWINFLLLGIFLYIDLEAFHLIYFLLPIFIVIFFHGNTAGAIALVLNIIAASFLAEESGNFSIIEIIAKEILALVILSSVAIAMNYHKNNVYKSNLTIIQTQNKQIIDSQKMHIIQRLSGNIAHDFNNTLMVISGYVELLELKIQNEGKIEEIDEIKNAIEKTKVQISQLQSLSRRQITNVETINLNEFFSKFYRIIKTLIHHHITVDLQVQNDELFVKMDRTNLHQIILNLILNSQDAILGKEDVSPIIQVKVMYCEFCNDDSIKERDFAAIEVHDKGKGIAEGILEQIFDPFFTTKIEGTGLGLAIVKDLVDNVNGVIKIESEIGTSTIVRVCLPLVKPPSLISDDPSKPETLTRPDLLRGMKILIVDDDELIVSSIVQYFSHYGVIIQKSVNVVEAMEIFKSSRTFDLVIADVIMPQKSGLEFFDSIKKLVPEQRFLFMSGHHRETRLDKILQGLNVDFIGKPFTMIDLVKKIEELVYRN